MKTIVVWGILAMAGAGRLVAEAAPAPVPAVYEAETAEAAGEAFAVRVAGASGGEAVRLGAAGVIRWSVSVPQAGRYELHLRYRAPEADVYQRWRINGTEWGVGFVRTGGDWLECARVFPLQAGPNRLELAGQKGGIEIDLLRLAAPPRDVPAPRYELPVLAPRQNTFHLEAPRVLRFVVQLNGHRLQTLTLGGRPVLHTVAPYPFLPDAVVLTLEAPVVAGVGRGRHRLVGTMEDGSSFTGAVTVADRPEPAPLVIAALDVQHGKATVLRLPDGSVALIDTAREAVAAERLVPFLRRQGVTRVDHLFLTHYHEDHAGGRALVEAACPVGRVYDHQSFRTGDTFQLGGVDWAVLNAWDAGEDENPRSLALRLEYRGFVYSDGGDNYGANQQRILERFPDWVRADVYVGNHHFHGSIDVNFLRRVDPALFLVSASEAVYARGAFMQLFKPQVEGYLKANDGRLLETLLTREVGAVVLRVRGGDDWSYETYAEPLNTIVPW